MGVVLVALTVGHLALGGWMLIDPGSFFREIGPFGVRNDHYTRDAGTFTFALGVGFGLAARWPGWRLGIAGYALMQYTFHAINHLVDIGKARPRSAGPLDFASLAVTAGLLGWLVARIARDRRAERW